MLYRSVWVTREDEARALPPGSFVHPDCRRGGILTYLVPIEAEKESRASVECEIGVPGTERIVHERRYVTTWEEA